MVAEYPLLHLGSIIVVVVDYCDNSKPAFYGSSMPLRLLQSHKHYPTAYLSLAGREMTWTGSGSLTC